VSAIYLVMLVLEVFWWPKRQQQVLANADRAVHDSEINVRSGERE
jgi:hypothetical protein